MTKSSADRWRAHPAAALALRALIVLVPLAFSYFVTLMVVHLLHGQIAATRWWLLAPAAVSVIACVALERLTRKLLPLAALLKLSMLFPDRAPTRYKVARQAFNVRSLSAKLANAPAGNASTAAEAALALITALTAHDRRTRGHSERVRVFTDLLGEQLRLPREARDKLRWVSLLHDIGKLRVATEILNKPAKLNPTEWEIIAAHPEAGAQLLGPLTAWLGEWADAVRQHHEKYDGTGYPEGVAGERISRAGRIVAVADAYEVMTAHRAYKKPMATAAARAELARCSGTQFDPSYVRAFLAIPLPKLLWAMGPGSLLMNLALLRAAADTANKGVLATAQSGVTAVSAAAVIGGVTATTGVPATAHAMIVASPVSGTHHSTPAPPQPTNQVVLPPAVSPAVKPTVAPTPVTTQAPAPPPPTPIPPVVSDTPTPTPAPPTPAPPTPTPTPTTPAPPVATAPGAPSGVAASAGDGQAVVFWDAPASDGGAPVTGYTITPVGPGGPLAPTMVGAASTTAIVTGLANGVSYTFAVTAVNAVGASAAAASTAVTPARAPSAPATVTAHSGDRQATVSWTVPASDGGSPITSYTVTPIGPGAGAPIVVGAGITSTVMTGLANGSTYTFSVSAANDAAGSPGTVSNAVIPAGAPGAPTNATAVRGNRQATVSWTAPADNGSAITGYTVTPIGPGGPLTPVSVAASTTAVTVSGLINGVSYLFRVSAINGVGNSLDAVTGSVVPATVAAAPGAVTVAAGDGQADVFWTAPADDGGSPVTGYTITASGPGAPPPVTVAGTSTSATVTGLTDGAAYTLTVTADNALGSSPAAVSGSVPPSAPAPVDTAPGAPTAAAASVGPGGGEATVTWAAPSTDGGSPVTSYTVTQLSGATALGSWILPASANSQSVSGLTKGTHYSFTIVANNAVGPSAPASTNVITAVSAPGPVSGVIATGGNTQATVSWTAPADDGGSPITGYTVTPIGSGGPLAPVTVAAPTTTATVTGLANGATYTFAVTATTAYGTSTPVTSAAVTPLAVNPDTAYVVKQQAVTIHVLNNDHGSLVAADTAVAVDPAHGTAIANPDGTISYLPTGGWIGTDQFTYRACDNTGNCTTALVTVRVLDHHQPHTDFSGLDMSNSNLTGIDFTNANLSGTNLSGAKLTNVNFSNANLDGAILSGANLTYTNFSNTDLVGADLAGDDLSSLDFTGADLSGADLSSANLTDANLNNVTVTSATNLTGANLTRVHGGPPPRIANQTVSTTLGRAVTINLLSLVSDATAPINPSSLTITQQPAHGTLVLHSNGTATYTPNALFVGGDQFSFRIANVLTFSTTGPVHLQVSL